MFGLQSRSLVYTLTLWCQVYNRRSGSKCYRKRTLKKRPAALPGALLRWGRFVAVSLRRQYRAASMRLYFALLSLVPFSSVRANKRVAQAFAIAEVMSESDF